MKRLVIATTALALVLGAAVAPAASAVDYPVVGRIAATYRAAGGSGMMGVPLAAEHKVRISGVNGYSQKFVSLASAGGISTVVWSRKDTHGGWATTASAPDPKLDKVTNERDGLAASGLVQGLVYRSADIAKASTADKLNLAGLLRGGVIIDLRSSGTRDPNLPGVKELRYPMTGTATLTTFVTRSGDRASLGKALRAVASAVSGDHAVLIHCHLGKDRTGWASAVLESLLGASDSAIRADYLRSSGANGQRLSDGLAAVASHYADPDLHGATHPGIYRYVTQGLGLSAQQVATLRTALA
jgi:hypothetical protein